MEEYRVTDDVMFNTYLKETGLEEEELVDIEETTYVDIGVWIDMPSAKKFREAANFLDAANDLHLHTSSYVSDGDLLHIEVYGTQDRLKEFIGLLWCEYETIVDTPDTWFSW